MKKLTAFAFAVLTALSASALKVEWNQDVDKIHETKVVVCYHGEDLRLYINPKRNGSDVAITGSTAEGWWQTKSMGDAWARTNAVITTRTVLGTTKYRFEIKWPKGREGNEDEVRFFVKWSDGGENPYQEDNPGVGEISYRVNFLIKFLGSPGANPEEVPIPRRTLDFTKCTVLNAPWATMSEIRDEFATWPEFDDWWEDKEAELQTTYDERYASAEAVGNATNELKSALQLRMTYEGVNEIINDTVTKEFVEGLGIRATGGGGAEAAYIIHTTSWKSSTVRESYGYVTNAVAHKGSVRLCNRYDENSVEELIPLYYCEETPNSSGWKKYYFSGWRNYDWVTWILWVSDSDGRVAMTYQPDVDFELATNRQNTLNDSQYGYPSCYAVKTVTDALDTRISGLTASDVGAPSLANYNQLATSVNTISAHLNAEDARFVVTNYDSVVTVPQAYITIKNSGAWLTIWKEMTRWTRFVGQSFDWNSWGNFHAWHTNVDAKIERKAEKCWGIYDSETGEYSPDGFTQISSSNILIAANMSYKRTVSTAGVWVLQCNSGVGMIGGDTNGYFRIKDGDGNTQFEIIKSSLREIGADAAGITVTTSGGNNILTIPYSVVHNTHPTLKICTDLATANWIAEGETGCAGTVTWSGSSGAYVATVTIPTTTTAAFVAASYIGGAEAIINNIAPTKMQYIYIGNQKYQIGYATINGTGVMTLTPQ